MNPMRNLFYLVFLIRMWTAAWVYTQTDASDPRGMGMGRAQTAVVSKPDAVLWNPAVLGLREPRREGITVTLLNAGGRAANNVLSVADYNRYNGAYLDERDKRRILGLFGGDPALYGNAEMDIRALGLQYQNYSADFSVAYQAYAQVPKKLLRTVWSDSAYRVGSEDLRLKGRGYTQFVWHTDVSGAYSLRRFFRKTFQDAAAGITVSYYHGMDNMTLKHMRAEIRESDSLISHGHYRCLRSSGGNGFGVHIGAAVQINDQWSAGLYLRNAIQNIYWTSRTKEDQGRFDIRSGTFFRFDDESSTTDTTIRGQRYVTQMPALLRAGAGYRYSPQWLFSGDAELHLYHVNKYASPRLSFGAEYTINKRFQVRGGVGMGGDNRGFNMACGVGWRTGRWQADFGTGHLEGLITGRRLAFAIGAKTVIDK